MIRRSLLLLRSPGFLSALLLTVMLLVQSGLIVHEVKHALAGDNEQCASCMAANHQFSITTNNISIVLPQFSECLSDSASLQLLTPFISHYNTRAPPASNFS